jgi:hypothetical protein
VFSEIVELKISASLHYLPSWIPARKIIFLKGMTVMEGKELYLKPTIE